MNAGFVYAELSFPGADEIEANETSTVLIILLGAFNLQRTLQILMKLLSFQQIQ